jgi:hypothetical protein
MPSTGTAHGWPRARMRLARGRSGFGVTGGSRSSRAGRTARNLKTAPCTGLHVRLSF